MSQYLATFLRCVAPISPDPIVPSIPCADVRQRPLLRGLGTKDETMAYTERGPLYPLSDAFKRLSISKTTGDSLIAAGQLVARKIGRRSVVSEADLRAFIA